MTPWEIRGQEMVNCNCNFGCPCQFSVLPTGGSCRAAIVYQIDKGHYGDVALDGLRVAAVYAWPKAIHDGDGQMQLIVDESADEAQCRAIETIMTGGDTEEMATMWFVYSRMSPNKHPTIRAPITLELGQEARTGRARVGEVFELHAKPVPHIVTGAPHRARINLPHGFEYSQAEVASGSTRTMGGGIRLEGLTDTHAHFATLHLNGSGVVREAAAPQ